MILPLDLNKVSKKYHVIYTDPCWSYYGDPLKDQAAGKHYDLMTLDQLSKLPVNKLAAKPCVMFMWATCPKLDNAVDLMRAWGFHFRGVAYVWVKTTKNGKIISGQGVRPSFVKPTTEIVIFGTSKEIEEETSDNSEFVLVGSTQKFGRSLPLLTESQGQVVLAPRGRHSEKPKEVRKRIEDLFGECSRLEMFAREHPAGWDAWGNEAGGAKINPRPSGF